MLFLNSAFSFETLKRRDYLSICFLVIRSINFIVYFFGDEFLCVVKCIRGSKIYNAKTMQLYILFFRL